MTGAPPAPSPAGTGWLQTFTGGRFHPLDPHAQELDVRDIAHALSLLCRFNGHCRQFYSVAEHSVRVSRLTPPRHARWGLLHDAAEAYVSDLPRPVKQLIPTFSKIEEGILSVVATRFQLGWPIPASVFEADRVLLATERRDLIVPTSDDWGLSVPPLPTRIHPMDPAEAERAFLLRFEELFPS